MLHNINTFKSAKIINKGYKFVMYNKSIKMLTFLNFKAVVYVKLQAIYSKVFYRHMPFLK